MKKIQITARTRAPEPITQSVLDKAVERGKMRQNTDKAIRLADELEFAASQIDAEDDVIHVARWFVEDAAAELRWLAGENEALRRLSAENEALRRERDEARRTVREAHEAGTRLTAQRDALLEALKQSLEEAIYPSKMLSDVYEKARAAIAKAEGA